MRKVYPDYKNSGVYWLGEVPKHWKVEKFAYHFVSGMGETILATELSDAGIPVYSATQEDKWFGFVEKAGLLLEAGDIVIPARGNSIGHVKLVKQKSTTTQTTIYSKAIRKNRNEPRFVKYFLEGNRKTLFEYDQTAIPQITVSQVSKNKIVIPPKIEQEIIANYLDRETGKIDSLIAKKNEFIERLKEKRTALISQVVTKGLPPEEVQKLGIPINTKTKPSGIAHIGDIPAYWNVKPLRYLGKTQNGISKEGAAFGTGFPFVSYGDAYRDFSLPASVAGLVESTEEERRIFSVLRGDIFFTRTSETVEEIGLASTCTSTIEDAAFAGFLIRFRPLPNILDVGFSKYYFRAEIHRRFFVKEVNIVTRASLSQDLLKKLPVLIPPKDEQKLIAEYLDDKTSQIDLLIQKTELAVEKLGEFRSSLITSAVTGKIDVREAAT